MEYAQIKHLLPEKVGTQRNVMYIKKAMRDARLLREYACFVIVLDRDEHNEVFCRETIDNSRGYIADVIAVLAPVSLFGGKFFLDQGLVFEIGMSRGRPYRQAETREHPKYSGQKIFVKGRRKLRDIEFDELVVAWAHAERHLFARTLKRQNERKKSFFILGKRDVPEAGVRVTVSKNDQVFYYKVVVEDERARQERYIATRARWITEILQPYLKTNVRGKRFRNLKGVIKVADCIRNMRRFTHAPNHIMRRLVGAIPGNVRALFYEILDMYGLSKLSSVISREPRVPPGLVLARKMPNMKEGRLWVVRKQGRHSQGKGRTRRVFHKPVATKQVPQAKGCVVAEHYLLPTF